MYRHVTWIFNFFKSMNQIFSNTVLHLVQNMKGPVKRLLLSTVSLFFFVLYHHYFSFFPVWVVGGRSTAQSGRVEKDLYHQIILAARNWALLGCGKLSETAL